MKRLLGSFLGVLLLSTPALAQTVRAGLVTKPILSPPLRLLNPDNDQTEIKRLVENYEVPQKTRLPGVPAPTDPVVQNGPLGLAHSPDVIGLNFDGAGVTNSAPPDTTGDVGRNHYVQWVNTTLVVFDKNGNKLYGPVKGNTLFQSLGGTCASHNDGDPLVQYDPMADRWVLTQFAVGATDGSFSHQCVAVSMSGDPLGSYYLYDFRTSTPDDPGLFVDYPHIGVWPDGYYLATHQFKSDGGFAQALYVFDREKMLAGLPATYVYYDFGPSAPGGAFVYGGALPADLDSLTPPPAGSPAFMVQHGSPDTDGSPGYVIHLWKVKVTWGASPSIQVTGPTDIPVAPFNGQLCTPFLGIGIALGQRPCIPQPAPAGMKADGTPYAPIDYWLDGIGDRLMYRVGYRNFGTHESLVLNHTVNATGHQAAVRWYELRNPGTAPTLAQQGTYAGPTPDLNQRWMASIAQDNSGNIALGYSKSSPTLLPEIDVAGRRANDPAGLLGSEILMKASSGVQVLTGNRWGDYSTMSVDAHDGCTFWFTSEYIPNEGQFNWKTRIGTFRYSSCAAPAQGTVTGTVTDCVTGAPMSRALVSLSNGFSGATDAQGRFSILTPPGTYTISASAPGRLCAPSASSTVSVSNGGTATKTFCLSGAPKLDFASSSLGDVVNKDECVTLDATIANNGCGVATGVTATLATSTSGVTVNQNKAAFGTIARDGSTPTSAPFRFSTSTANGFRCGAPIDFTLSVASDQGATTMSFSVPTCQAATISRSGSLTAADSQQAARMGRNSVATGCGSTKACPAPLGTGVRVFDQYSFTNSSEVAACVNVNLTADGSCNGVNEIFSAAYLDSYDPQNLCANYLADLGSSPNLGFNNYAFEVPAGRTFVVIVNTVQEGGACPAYNLNVSGLVDNSTSGNGACPTPPVINCYEETDAQLAFGNGWHLGDGFRYTNSAGTTAAFDFDVTGSSGKVTWKYGKSTKGGSADVYVDGAFRETVSFAGSSGGTKTPQLGFSATYAGLAAGAHRVELRNIRGVAYVDGFCVEQATSTAAPAAGPGATTSGQSMTQSVALPPGTKALSVIAEASLPVPLQLLLIGPDGVTLATSTAANGLATLDVANVGAGMYTVKAVNLSIGPVSVWMAATPLVSR
jgi:Carboxypeptidase regulatory-like domain